MSSPIDTLRPPPGCDSETAAELRIQIEYACGQGFLGGHSVQVLCNGDQIFPAMLEAIDAAQRSVILTTFVYWTGDIAERFAEALSRKAAQGVPVKVVLDSVGAGPMRKTLVKRMKSAGVQIRWFRPFRWLRPWQYDKRTHRKILLCDNALGFIGGVGIAQQWEGDARDENEWRETHLRLEGSAVAGLHSAFLDNWHEAGGWEFSPINKPAVAQSDDIPVQILRASSTIGWTESAALLRTLIELAKRQIRITTAYFAPDPTLVDILIKAARRGVDIQILIPGTHTDARISQLAGQPSVERLLQVGVAVWTFSPTMLHAKIITIDGCLACVGSVNVNHRSMGKDEECSALVLNEAVTGTLDEQFGADRDRAERLDFDTFAQRSLWVRVQERAARLVIEQL